jgi:hypothetical protein
VNGFWVIGVWEKGTWKSEETHPNKK